MKIIKSVSLLILIIYLQGCKKEVEESPVNKSTIIIQGYLYAGMPVSEILIQKMNIGSLETASDIDNVSAQIIHNNISYQLQAMPNKSGYYYCVDTTLQVISGETYTIEVEHGEKIVHASTTVPPPITTLVLDANIIELSNGNNSYNSINLAWQTPENYNATLFLLNATELANSPILEGAIDCSNYTNPTPFNTIISNSETSLFPCDFSHIGTHKLMIATVNPESEFLYVDNSLSDVISDSGNIINGSGIFTSLNGYQFEVEINQ
jgi:Domain of unknown function (DUF4249)